MAGRREKGREGGGGGKQKECDHEEPNLKASFFIQI